MDFIIYFSTFHPNQKWLRFKWRLNKQNIPYTATTLAYKAKNLALFRWLFSFYDSNSLFIFYMFLLFTTKIT